MSENCEMETMLACAPVGPGEALVPVLCVEATADTQDALQKAVRAMAAGTTDAADGGSDASSSSSSPAAAALAALHKLPGTRLRVSPYTTIHVLRSFLEAEEAAATTAGGASALFAMVMTKDSLANAQFFAVRVPATAATAASEVRVGDADDDDEVLTALHDNTTLDEVLRCGRALQVRAPETAATLVLLYSRERRFGGWGGSDISVSDCASCCADCCDVAGDACETKHRKDHDAAVARRERQSKEKEQPRQQKVQRAAATRPAKEREANRRAAAMVAPLPRHPSPPPVLRDALPPPQYQMDLHGGTGEQRAAKDEPVTCAEGDTARLDGSVNVDGSASFSPASGHEYEHSPAQPR